MPGVFPPKTGIAMPRLSVLVKGNAEALL